MRDCISGHVRVLINKNDGSQELLLDQHNQIQDGYATILPLLMSGSSDGKINTLYLEYENVPSPETTVSPSDFPSSDGPEYYTNLTGSTDFLRHPIIMTPRVSEGCVSFEVIIGEGTGFHGKSFGEGVNSRIYGMALVAAKSDDQSRDVVFARTLWDTQHVKTNETFTIYWDIHFSI